MIPSPGETFVGELGHSTRNSGGGGDDRVLGGYMAAPGEGQEEGDKHPDPSHPRTSASLWENPWDCSALGQEKFQGGQVLEQKQFLN